VALLSPTLEPALLLAVHRFVPKPGGGGEEGSATPLSRAADFHDEMRRERHFPPPKEPSS
jgi:hypothetical protein